MARAIEEKQQVKLLVIYVALSVQLSVLDWGGGFFCKCKMCDAASEVKCYIP